MDAQTIIIIVAIGIVAGMLSGLVGIGGGIIIVPALIYLLGFTQKNAQGTSLAILLLPIGIFAVLQYYRQGHIDFKVVAILSAGFLAGGYFGSKIALNLPEDTIRKIFAIMMILIAVKMLFFDKSRSKAVIQTSTSASIEKSTDTQQEL